MNSVKIVTVCINRRASPELPSCGARGGIAIADALEAAIAEQNLPVRVERFKCLGKCELGPNVKLSPGGEFWHGVAVDDLSALLQRIAEFSRN